MDQDATGTPVPIVLGLSRDAKSRWIAYYNRHDLRQANASGDLAAAWAKVEGYAARLGLVVHCVRAVTGQCGPDIVDADSIGGGIALADWFADEAERVYRMLGASDEQRELARLVEAIRLRGGQVTVRDWQTSRGLASAEGAAEDLTRLVAAGLGEWIDLRPGPRGGRPSRVFRLRTQPATSRTGKTDDDEPTNASETQVSPVLQGAGSGAESAAVHEAPIATLDDTR